MAGPEFFAPPTALCMIEANTIIDEFRTAQVGSSKPQTAAIVAWWDMGVDKKQRKVQKRPSEETNGHVDE